jgi:hypothetical protein
MLLFALCPDTTEPFFVMKRRTGRNSFHKDFAARAFDEAHDKIVHQTLLH